MSVAKITTVQAARKDQGTCGKCGVEIKKGDGYLHYTVGFRSHWKRVRCLKTECYPPPSERESSAKATPMAALEEFEKMSFESIEDLQSAWEDVQAAYREYADEKDAALEAWEYGNSMLEEQRDGAEAAAEAVEGENAEDYDEDEPDESDEMYQSDEEEPQREDFDSEEEYEEAYAKWEDQEDFEIAHGEWEEGLAEHINAEHERLIEVANDAQGEWI